MGLRTIVKVGCITNLSDARYCAGMGVDMLGFSVIEGQDGYVSPSQFQEMRGWVAGPKIVAEIYGLTSPEQLDRVLENYRPDYLELSLNELKHLASPLPLPSIVRLNEGEASSFTSDFVLITNLSQLSSLSTPSLVEVSAADQISDDLLSKVQGIALRGSAELRPGLKEYDLADILEGLEVND
jgi:phosphoribosylanthranilate isomerase